MVDLAHMDMVEIPEMSLDIPLASLDTLAEDIQLVDKLEDIQQQLDILDPLLDTLLDTQVDTADMEQLLVTLLVVILATSLVDILMLQDIVMFMDMKLKS